jgi:hypothetical protein
VPGKWGAPDGLCADHVIVGGSPVVTSALTLLILIVGLACGLCRPMPTDRTELRWTPGPILISSGTDRDPDWQSGHQAIGQPGIRIASLPEDREIALKRYPIRDWPEGERPRERLLAEGPRRLTTAELLGIVLRTGARGWTWRGASCRIGRRWLTWRLRSRRAWPRRRAWGRPRLPRSRQRWNWAGGSWPRWNEPPARGSPAPTTSWNSWPRACAGCKSSAARSFS